MSKIALICPTRGRPVQFRRMVDSAMRTAQNPDNIHVYFYLAETDSTRDYYPNLERTTRFLGHDWSAVMASNYLAQHTNGESLLFMCADDCVFSTPHWDTALLEASKDGKPCVFSLLDSRDPNGTPHPIVSRSFMEVLGYFMPPIFLHWHCDTWVSDIAKSTGCFVHLRDYLLIHDKPSDRGQPDETHRRIRDLGWNIRDKYVNDVCQDYLAMQKEKVRIAHRVIMHGEGSVEHVD